MDAVPQQNDALLKAMALRAFLEMDWEDIAPPSHEHEAWSAHWALLQAACSMDWNTEILALTNASWSYNERFDRLEDLRRFVEKQKVAVTKSWMRHRQVGWGRPW
jgi:hypothetical protein